MKKTGDPLGLRQRRKYHLLRPLEIFGIRPNRKALAFAHFRSFHSSHLECIAVTTELEPATFTVIDLGGETRMGRSIDTAIMHAIRWSPLVYDPLLCRKCAMSNGPNALAEPHAVSISP